MQKWRKCLQVTKESLGARRRRGRFSILLKEFFKQKVGFLTYFSDFQMHVYKLLLNVFSSKCVLFHFVIVFIHFISYKGKKVIRLTLKIFWKHQTWFSDESKITGILLKSEKNKTFSSTTINHFKTSNIYYQPRRYNVWDLSVVHYRGKVNTQNNKL